MTVPASPDGENIERRYAGLIRHSRRQSMVPVGVIMAVLAYVVYAGWVFEIPRLISNVRLDRGVILATDTFAHKYHVVKRFQDGDIEVSLEGTRDARITDNFPDWINIYDNDITVDLGEGYGVSVEGQEVVLSRPDSPPIRILATAQGVSVTPQDLPEWARVSPVKFDARPTLFKRVQVSRAKVEVHRYFSGWENFFFDFNSPLGRQSEGREMQTIISDERIDPAMPNWQFALHSFWNNKEWQHKDVFRALLETVIMALLGTLVASAIALPLAFAAAANFNRSFVLRMLVRRSFDFLRGIDTLIWSLIFIRAFGLGPLTGIMAIVFTMVGELGKLYSEAIENIDDGEVEGVRATGASRSQGYVFGVLPQIMPVFISQTLYYLESNTRSATIIGALGAGGIGLMLVQTIQTSRDWENTLYLIVLTLLVVILMDLTSGWLRRRLL